MHTLYRLYLHNSDIKEMPEILEHQQSERYLIRNVVPADVDCDRARYSHSQDPHRTLTKKHQSPLRFRVSQQTSVSGLLEGSQATFIWTLNDIKNVPATFYYQECFLDKSLSINIDVSQERQERETGGNDKARDIL